MWPNCARRDACLSYRSSKSLSCERRGWAANSTSKVLSEKLWKTASSLWTKMREQSWIIWSAASTQIDPWKHKSTSIRSISFSGQLQSQRSTRSSASLVAASQMSQWTTKNTVTTTAPPSERHTNFQIRKANASKAKKDWLITSRANFNLKKTGTIEQTWKATTDASCL